MSITLIGDCHGKYNEYYEIASKSEYTVQVGDFGFGSAYNKLHYSDLDPKKHKVLKGNHCSYESPHKAHSLGDFGEATLGGANFFFIRGGLSIDRVYRIGDELGGSPKTYWSQEELNLDEMMECMRLYAQALPEIVISHVPPASFGDKIVCGKHSILQKYKFHVGFKENTARLGDQLLKIHKPKAWYCGHMHKSFTTNIDGVNFRCLAELESCELEVP
ncbi:MAG TPA: metallophosphoesterase [Chitinophagaceae bacterium]|nr:metallophosphoesterase [Chitinophagaceae bacterium]